MKPRFMDTATLVHTSTNVAKQILDTAQFIRKHMNRNSVLIIMDPVTHYRITMMYPIVEWETDLENVLCAYCGQEDSYIQSVVKNHSNQMVVSVPLKNNAFKQNAVYAYMNYALEYLSDIKA
jgi:hypothetical protein